LPLAYESPADMVFGVARRPLRYGLGLEVGNGRVVPELKYWPSRAVESEPSLLVEEYERITAGVLERALDLGMEAIQLETELSYQVTLNPRLAGEIVTAQKSLLEKFSGEGGLKTALRVTVADIRGMRSIDCERACSLMFETFESSAASGADLLSIESTGGKEVHDYSLVRGFVPGIVFSLAVLAVRDMRHLWREIVKIAARHNCLPAGDSACGFANTAMKLAGGLRRPMIPHVLAAVDRAISVSRSLVAYEEGAVGPGKDCGYENVFIKALTGLPMAMEGKSSACAHSSLVGNIAAAVCDLWSNEQVENVKLFGGTAPQVFLEVLYYDTALMNAALEGGSAHALRDSMIRSDKFRDPQSFILAPDVAWKISRAVDEARGDPYVRAVRAGLAACTLMMSEDMLRLSPAEARYLEKIRAELNGLPDDADELEDLVLSQVKVDTPLLKYLLK